MSKVISIAAKVFLVAGICLLTVGITNVLHTNNNKEQSTPAVAFVDKSTLAPEAELPLPKGKRKVAVLKIKASRTLVLDAEMGQNTLFVAEGIKALAKDSSDPIYLLMMSPGGSVLAGAALLSAIEASRAPVNIVCRIMCASMAAITLQYGHKRYATDRTLLMYHPAAMGADGDVDRMYSELVTIKRFTNKMEAHVAKRMGLSFDDYKNLSGRQIWIDAEDALAKGYIDGIVDIQIEQDVRTLPFNIPNGGEERGHNFFKSLPLPKKSNKNIFETVRW